MIITFKKAFSLTDGRMSTNVDDIYDMLNYIFSANFQTIELPAVYDILKKKNPQWFSDAVKQLNAIKAIVGNDFDSLMKYIDDNLSEEYITMEKIDLNESM